MKRDVLSFVYGQAQIMLKTKDFNDFYRNLTLKGSYLPKTNKPGPSKKNYVIKRNQRYQNVMYRVGFHLIGSLVHISLKKTYISTSSCLYWENISKELH